MNQKRAANATLKINEKVLPAARFDQAVETQVTLRSVNGEKDAGLLLGSSFRQVWSLVQMTSDSVHSHITVLWFHSQINHSFATGRHIDFLNKVHDFVVPIQTYLHSSSEKFLKNVLAALCVWKYFLAHRLSITGPILCPDSR